MTITVAILFLVKETAYSVWTRLIVAAWKSVLLKKEAANIAAALKKLGKNAAASRIVARGEKPMTFVK